MLPTTGPLDARLQCKFHNLLRAAARSESLPCRARACIVARVMAAASAAAAGPPDRFLYLMPGYALSEQSVQVKKAQSVQVNKAQSQR